MNSNRFVLCLGVAFGILVGLGGCGSNEAASPVAGEHGEEHEEAHDEHEGEAAEGHEEGHDEPDEGVVHLSAEAMTVSEIRVGTATRRAMSGGGAFPAEIAFDPSGTAHVSSLGGGRFASVDTKLGDVVEPGQLLATLVSTDVADLEGQLAHAKARLRGAEAESRRNAMLVKEGVGPERGLVDARAAVATLRAEVAGIRRRLAVFGPQVEGLVALKAPISGIVAGMHAVVGESARADEPAFTITDPARIFVEVFIPELDIARVAVGAAVVVRTHAYPEMALAGHIAVIAPSLDHATRSLSARVVLDAPDIRLRGNMFAMVELDAMEGRSIAVPADGVAVVQGQDVVFVPGKEANSFVPKPVRLGRRSSGYVEILAGLDEGDTVVVHGGFVLKSALSGGSISEGHAH